MSLKKLKKAEILRSYLSKKQLGLPAKLVSALGRLYQIGMAKDWKFVRKIWLLQKALESLIVVLPIKPEKRNESYVN